LQTVSIDESPLFFSPLAAVAAVLESVLLLGPPLSSRGRAKKRGSGESNVLRKVPGLSIDYGNDKGVLRCYYSKRGCIIVLARNLF